ncbi:hypothetical protein [Thermocatellispora tengchongensis]|uniref:hypothetical protein n=1 Tax=Thermocatellispora tengchongensis TaxID=1073253 RepID=UPI003638BF87
MTAANGSTSTRVKSPGPAGGPRATGPDGRKGARRRRRRTSGRQAVAGWLFVAPFAVLLVAFLLLPMGYAAKLSLYRSTLVEGRSSPGSTTTGRRWPTPSSAGAWCG